MPLRLLAAAGNGHETARLQLQAEEGSWWITQTGRVADIILQPGDKISLGFNGLLLAEPLPSRATRHHAPVSLDRLEPETEPRCLGLPCGQLAISRRYFAAELQVTQRWENIFHGLLWASSLIALALFIFGNF